MNTIVSASGTLTNRGLIDSHGDTQINAGTLNNIGTGRIYGNRISIGAGALNNDAETVDGITKSASIAARDSLDIGAGTINNRDRSLIFSASSMSIGGALDGGRKATGQGGVLNNLSADIEALGNMSIAMGQVNNLDTHLQVGQVTTTASTTYLATTDGKIWSYDDTWGDPVTRAVYHRAADGSVSVVGFGYADWHVNTETRRDTATHTDPARIVAGGNLDISGHLLNRDSKVIAGGTLSASSVDNQATQGTQTVTETLRVAYAYSANPADPAPVPLFFSTPPSTTTVSVGSYEYTPHANGTSGQAPGAAADVAVGATAAAIGGVSSGRGAGAIIEVPANVGSLAKASGSSAGTTTGSSGPDGTTSAPTSSDPNAVGNSGSAGGTAASGAQASASGTIPMVVRTRTPDASVPTASLFATRPEPGSRYLIETDPRFANYRQWLSSDYLLNALGLDPDYLQKRLGDGFYEQRLIREQIAQLTGHRYLDGFFSDEEQYTALMNAGATFAKEYGLRPGVALTAAQMAQLTSDIVWLVEQTVTLPDSSTQKVLVPQVYVRVRPGDIDGSGALLSADALKIKSDGDVTNTGTIAGRTLVAINADNINNLGGRISGGNVALEAVNDLNNIGGTIDARDSLSVKAGRDINIRTTTTTSSAGLVSGTSIDRVAGLYVTDPGGTLVASAGRDVNLIGAVVANQGSGATSIKAGNDINLGTITTSSTTVGLGDGALMGLSTRQEVGSSISAGGKLALDAGHDLNARAATVTAIGDLGVKAGNDITIESGRSQSALAYTAQWGGGGLLSRSSNSFQAQITTDSATGSHFSGANVDMQAGRDVNVVGSDVSAANDLRVAAGRNLNIVSAVETTQADAQSSRSESGVLAPRGFRIDAARGQQQSASMSTQSERASNLSAGGNATFTAGEQVNVYASNLSAGQTLDITGREVNVYSGINQREGSYGVQHTRSTMGLTGTIGRSGTTGLSSRASEDNRIEETTLAPTTVSGNRVNITATDGDVTLVGARINATESASLNAEQGAVNFGVVVTGTESSQARGGKDLMYQRNADSGARTESANYTQINSPNLTIKAPQVNVQVGQNLVYGGRDQAVGIPIQSLSQAIASQTGQPGMQWLTQVQNDAQLNNLQVNWQGVEVAQRHWAESQSGLTQTGAAVVTIVASVLTWGYGASWSGYAANSAMGAAMNAGLSSIASQASVSLINNNGNVGAVLDELGSSQGIRRIVTAMATAGVVQGLNEGLGISGWTTANGAGTMQVIGRNLVDGAAAAVVRTAVNGGSLQDNLAEALANGLLNTAASESAGWIGSNTTGLANAVSHAIAGCLVGAGRATAGGYGGGAGDGCSAGAIGAVVGEIAAGYYNPMHDPAFASETISFGQLMAGIAGALVGGDQASADIAAAAGGNAVENNQFGVASRALMAAQRICAAYPALCVGAAAGTVLQTQLGQRASELQRQNPGLTYDRALDVASSEVISRSIVNGAINAWNTVASWFEATPAGGASTTPGYGAGRLPNIASDTGNTTALPNYGTNTGGNQIVDPYSDDFILGGGYAAGGAPGYGGATTTPNNGPLGGSVVMSQGWTEVNESMSQQPRDYQTQITGVSGQAYIVNGVKFDGVASDGTLLDAKGPGYGRFVLPNGEFAPWFNGAQDLIDQAERQIRVAGGSPIQWSVAEPSAARAMQTLLSDAGIRGIKIINVPPK